LPKQASFDLKGSNIRYSLVAGELTTLSITPGEASR